MALPVAIALGIVAAVGVPFAMGGAAGADEIFAMTHYRVGQLILPWSWTIFCVVTLGAWGLIGWARRG